MKTVIILLGVFSIMLVGHFLTQKSIKIFVDKNNVEWVIEVEGQKTYRKATLLDYKDARVTYVK